ncbi:phage virion morphogenesis protein [Vibrio sp. OPT18]|uniref:phage virion morphogenesis protein n=1 Tax=Vibrio sp. OPT18 TaxID=2778641 RepID=UPI00187F99C6|nr:phage virion morphogenesis protein [Vibrio sp. OPT18]MBE8574458.1 phage virion morphogenesis protein [Vibrio sp. OPT18]
MTLTTPEQLTRLIQSLALSDSDKFELNKMLANHTRRYFRGQIRQQRDIDKNPYQARTRRKITTLRKGNALNTVNNKNILMGLSKSIRAQVSPESFAVGLTGVAGKIGRVHNNGSTVEYTRRLKGYFNRKTGQWEGGIHVKANYRMPKRTFLGWTPALEKELMAMIATRMLQGENH